MLDKLAGIGQKLGPGLRQVLSNIAWLFTDQILQMGLGLVVGLWVARYLGPTQFGLLNYAIAFVSLFSSVATMGLGTLVVRNIARDPECKNETLGTAFGLQFTGGCITLVLTVTVIALLKPNDTLTRWLVGIIAAGTIFNAFEAINFWFQSQIQSKYTVLAKNSVCFLVAAVRIGLVTIKAPLLAFAWVRLAEVALVGMAYVYFYKLTGNKIKDWQFSWDRSKELLSESWPIILSGLAIYLYSKTDQIMLGAMNKNAELGYYAAAVKISEICDFLPMILSSSIFPKLANLRKTNYEEYLNKFQIYSDIMIFLWLGVAIPISLLSPWIVHLLYGENYAKSAAVLSLYVWAQFGSNFGVARSTYLNIEAQLRYGLYLTVVGSIFNVALNFWLIPKYGAFGATMATLITYFYVIILVNFLIKELRPFANFIWRSLNLYKAACRIRGLVK
ncbi:polysaccharide biosynthesis protein [Oscillatoria nigro-viridis PCC 7112]|uniref:Polysaccharide biosynthesis protein n=1 Tax=Phormidium nigroviride PCC 7112 TaxID=179408 RepID=K9VM82_9CYAN|nr:flippase [Oscillatoria nigro-viridis]AFZ08577.1 polysaccharide biosynthesis protein [Oscillatoria nigro-viridis PCC 7112]